MENKKKEIKQFYEKYHKDEIINPVADFIQQERCNILRSLLKDISTTQVPFIKRWGNKAFNSLINILTRQHFTDTQCGFRAYSREAILRLNLFGGFTYTQEVFLDLVNKGLKIEQVPIKVKYYKNRKAKISSSLFNYFLRTIVIILRTFRDYKPLVFFGIPGLTVFGAGIIFELYSLIYWLIHHQTTPVRMYFFIGIALLTFGFLLIIPALIADMLKRIRQNQEEILYKPKKKSMKNKRTILFICGAKESYVRNFLNLKALEKNFNVIKITSSAKSYFIRLPSVIFRFLFSFKKYDLVFVGFLGQPLMPFVKFFSRKPIIFDAFISLYDTLCFDRKLFKAGSILGRLAYWFDKKSCQWVNKIITDTNAHANYFSSTFNIDRDKFQTIYLGAEEDIFYPQNTERKEKYKNKFIVFYYGSVLPLQGIDIILKTVKLLEYKNDIIFQLAGPIRKRYKNLIEKLNLKNIEFLDWVPYEKLSDRIVQADICLGGHFSDIDKAKRVISGKTFQFIAMKKPVIVGDNMANKELFIHKENIYMCKMANEKALAEAILELKNDEFLREKIAERGYQLYYKKCIPMQISKDLLNILKTYEKMDTIS